TPVCVFYWFLLKYRTYSIYINFDALEQLSFRISRSSISCTRTWVGWFIHFKSPKTHLFLFYEKQVHFLSGSTLCAKADNSDPDVDILRTDDPTFNDRDQQPSLTQATSIPITENDTSVKVNGETDAVSEAIEKRKQPLMELAYSEESYVRRLRVVYELYIFEELASKLPPGGPTVPDDLVARWRILWGNWVQLLEWHTGFYEKLRTLLEDDPDRIPKLFIDSRARLRSIYSKYCENQIKAAHIAEQHKEFFDEWRVHVGDKEDVVSLLMQPVQRIMRYQLPISEIVKWTERAKLSSLVLWQKALDIMKEIPKDTQLILEVDLFLVRFSFLPSDRQWLRAYCSYAPKITGLSGKMNSNMGDFMQLGARGRRLEGDCLTGVGWVKRAHLWRCKRLVFSGY
ncbi:unnamed protein product, partial [Hydatigera taeniaeformis]|uniref:DH domain-containing protein n=1 Tax=Hydatigena taeniaeformis TaxID=6205 RepID=A0A0R3WSJ1_HYDTA